MRQRFSSAPPGPVQTSRRATVWVVGVAALIQLAVLARIRLSAVNSVGGDLCQDVAAMHRILSGQNPYGRLAECGVLAYSPHPPVSLLVMAPFTWLPVAPAGLLWDLAGLLMVTLSLALIARALRITLHPVGLAVALGLLIFWPPLLDTLLEAQMSPALLLLLTLTWLWRRAKEPELAGAALGVAAAIRLFPALVGVYFLLRRDWRTLYGMVTAFLAVSALALLLIGPGGYRAFVGDALPGASRSWGDSPHNVSLWGLADHIAPHTAAGGLGFLLVAAYLAFVITRTWRRRGQGAREDEATLLLYYPAMLLVSPLGWQYYFLLLLGPTALIARETGWLGQQVASFLTRRHTLLTRGLLVAFLTLLWLYHLPPVAATLGASNWLLLALPTVALVALSAALALLPPPSSRVLSAGE